VARTLRVVALGRSSEAGRAEIVGSQHRQDFGPSAVVVPDHELRRQPRQAGPGVGRQRGSPERRSVLRWADLQLPGRGNTGCRSGGLLLVQSVENPGAGQGGRGGALGAGR
jgi:hypothetical protein